MIGETISHYTVLGKLGQGGMGEVFLAQDTSLDRKVALKFLPEDAQQDPSARRRILREAKAAAAIDHPFICKIYEAGDVDGRAFIGMEFVEGETLQQRLKTAALPLKMALHLAGEIAEALAKAHSLGIVHRDLKPANIMLTAEGHVKVMDFGLATRLAADPEATQETSLAAGQVVGTITYMSPEQVRGQPLDQRTDLFSLGIILYEMLTGVHPFRKKSSLETAMAITQEEQWPISRHIQSCPQLLDHIVRKLLTKEAAKRYQLAAEVQNDLRQLEENRLEHVAESRPEIASIAVLPFANASANPENEYFSDGITEDIIAQLSKIPGLKIISRSSVLRYKGTDKPPDEIARELGVDTILEGSVRRSGNRVRIFSGLVDVHTHRQLWSETYDREMDDIFAIQSEVSRQIATTLKTTLSPTQQLNLQPSAAHNLEAYHLYLKGRHFLGKNTPDAIQKAIHFFQQALDIEPTYARSYAAISTAYANCGNFSYLPPGEAFPKAKAAARRALELDEGLAEAHVSMALVMLFHDWNLPEAERGFQRGIELNPTSAEAHLYYTWYLTAVGRFNEAVVEARSALELDPLSPFMGTNLGWALQMASRHDQAIEEYKKTLELDPNFVFASGCLAAVYIEQNRYEEGLALLKQASWNPLQLAQGYAVAGDPVAARKIVAEVTDASQRQHCSPLEVAMVHFFLGDAEEGFTWLEKSYQLHENKLIYLKQIFRRVPQLQRYYSDSRCQDLLRRVGLQA
jgi:serine/threonine protein kinase/Flp pilus assembly protein TadD